MGHTAFSKKTARIAEGGGRFFKRESEKILVPPSWLTRQPRYNA